MSVIYDMLRYVGVGPQYRGYRYLSVAVELVIQHGGDDVQVTKAIYPAIAQRYNTTGDCVERDIRTAIRRAWESGGQEPLSTLAGHPLEQRPTNRQFICLLADQLRRAAQESPAGMLWVQFLTEE